MDDFARGVECGFPVCCVLDFVSDRQHGRMPAQRRPLMARVWSRVGERSCHYVMCRRCAEENRGHPRAEVLRPVPGSCWARVEAWV